MRALLFLTLNQLKNSIRRSLTSATRLIALLVFVSYYYFALMRGVWAGQRELTQSPYKFDFPPVEILTAIAFGVGLLVTFLFWSTVGVQRGSFRSADVDMLFPTPISPRLVLAVRMIRENIVSLLLPFIVVIFSGPALKAPLQAIFKQAGIPHGAGSVYGWMILAWIINQMMWIAIGYAFTLSTYQEGKREWLGRLINWSCLLGLVGVAAYIGLAMQGHATTRTFLDMANAGPLRYAIPSATAISLIATAPLTGAYAVAGLAIAGCLGVTAVAIAIAMKHVGAMYEFAAMSASAAESTRDALKAGDMLVVFRQKAAQGKLKLRRVGWVERLQWRGAWAVAWRDLIIMLRTSAPSLVFFLVLALLYTVLPAAFSKNRDVTIIGLVTAPLITWISVWSYSRSSFIDLLRRVDSDKSLPLSLLQLVLAHSIMRNLAAVGIGWLICLAVMIMNPPVAMGAVAIAIALPAFAFLVSGSVLLFMLIFPDVEDPSQRTLRELLTTFLMFVAIIPGAVAGGLVLLVGEKMYVVAALAASVTNVLVVALLYLACAELYAAHNPNE